MYSFWFVDYVFDSLVHLFGFGQKFAKSSFLFDLVTVHRSKIKKLISQIINAINLPLNQRHLMTKFSQFNTLKTFKSLQDSRIFRPNIPIDDSLNKPDLFNSIFQSIS